MSDLLTRRDYAFTLKTLSPLHIGSGEDRYDLLPGVPEGAGERAVAVAAIQRTGGKLPFIPGTTLKGALVAQGQALGLAEVPSLFGEQNGTTTGRMGAVLVRGAALSKTGPTTGLPFAKDGVFVQSRSAIDAGRGIAETNKLFHAEMVASGAEFAVKLRLETRGNIQVLESALLKILGAFAAASGVAIGADRSSGQGILQLVGKVTVTEWRAKITGRLEPNAKREVQPVAPQSIGQLVRLRLTCRDAYLSRDPSWSKDSRKAAQEAKMAANLPHLKALRLDRVPFVTGQGVSGALRARASWLYARQCVAAGQTVTKSATALPNTGAARSLPKPERLFGITGFRGVLSVSVGKARTTGIANLTSVKIDRFAGGTVDNALFGTDADYGVQFDLTLALDSRATDADRAALVELVDDLDRNGLRLGHGTTHGMGWFKVEQLS